MSDRDSPSARWVRQLLGGKPIEPVHEKPDGIPFDAPAIFDDDRTLFEEFTNFAVHLNCVFAEGDGSPWRLKELSKTARSSAFGPFPQYGRRYVVFYNHESVGSLDLETGPGGYRARRKSVRVSLSIKCARLLPFREIDALVNFTIHIVAMFSQNPDGRRQVELARQVMLSRMVEAVWRTGPEANHNPDLDLEFLCEVNQPQLSE
jgi:hypothetical protein